MPRPYNAGSRGPICLHQVNHAFWGVCPGIVQDDGTVCFFSDDAVFGGVALPEGFFGSQAPILKDSPDTLPTSTNIPSEDVAMEEVAPIGGPLEEPITTQVPHKK